MCFKNGAKKNSLRSKRFILCSCIMSTILLLYMEHIKIFASLKTNITPKINYPCKEIPVHAHTVKKDKTKSNLKIYMYAELK